MEYANHIGYSDINPYEIISRTKKTILVREMKSELKSTFRPTHIPGGFAGHCINQDQQEWIICSDINAPIERAHLHKDGFYWIPRGKLKLSDKPIKYYDFNF